MNRRQQLIKNKKPNAIELMPNLLSRDDVLDYYGKSYGCNRETANRKLRADEEALKRNPKRSRLKRDADTGTLRGRYTPVSDLLAGRPTEGGKDNLRNFLTKSLTGCFYTSDEVRNLLASRYGDESADSQFKMACDPARQILQYHKSVHRWSSWGAPPPDPVVFAEELAEGKLAERIALYGSMPRLRHKPGEKFSFEDSEVLRWMSAKSSEPDLEKVQAEWNRLPKASIDSRSGVVGRSVLVFDRATRETMGILTFRTEDRARQEAADKAKAVSEPSLDVYDEDCGPQDGEEYWHCATRIVKNEDKCDIEFEEWYGDPGKKKKGPDIDQRLLKMERMTPNKAARYLRGFFTFNVDAQRLIDEAIGENYLHRHDDGDLEGAYLVG